MKVGTIRTALGGAIELHRSGVGLDLAVLVVSVGGYARHLLASMVLARRPQTWTIRNLG